MLPQFLKMLRLRTGKSVHDVHLSTKLPKSTLHHWETGHQTPPPKRLGVLLAFYEASGPERLVAYDMLADYAPNRVNVVRSAA